MELKVVSLTPPLCINFIATLSTAGAGDEVIATEPSMVYGIKSKSYSTIRTIFNTTLQQQQGQEVK